MILAISGPSSTGKTTLLRELVNNYDDELRLITNCGEIVLVEETARTLFRMHYGDKYKSFEELLNNDRDIIEFQLLVAEDQISRYAEYLATPKTLYLCDRCPLDTMVYLSMNYRHTSNRIQSEYAGRYFSMMSKLLKCYQDSQVVAFRTIPNYEDDVVEEDGFRPLQYIDRRVNEIIAFDLIDADVPVLMQGVSSRVEYILSQLKDDTYEEL